MRFFSDDSERFFPTFTRDSFNLTETFVFSQMIFKIYFLFKIQSGIHGPPIGLKLSEILRILFGPGSVLGFHFFLFVFGPRFSNVLWSRFWRWSVRFWSVVPWIQVKMVSFLFFLSPLLICSASSNVSGSGSFSVEGRNLKDQKLKNLEFRLLPDQLHYRHASNCKNKNSIFCCNNQCSKTTTKTSHRVKYTHCSDMDLSNIKVIGSTRVI